LKLADIQYLIDPGRVGFREFGELRVLYRIPCKKCQFQFSSRPLEDGRIMSDLPIHSQASEIETDQRWRLLCESASKEQDPDKLLKLVQEIIKYPVPKNRI
jgi:hypothetical protein